MVSEATSDKGWKPAAIHSDMPVPDQVLWHIHLDTEHIDDTFDEYLQRELGFTKDDFVSHEDVLARRTQLEQLGFDMDTVLSGVPPTKHRTWKTVRSQTGTDEKTKQAAEFRRALGGFEAHVTQHPDAFRGYLEAENSFRWTVPNATKPFTPSPSPFHLSLKTPDDPKTADLHISFPLAGTDPRLVERYREMGLYVVCTPKLDDPREIRNLILTAQGQRQEIRSLIPLLWKDLQAVGGYGNGTKLIDEDIRIVKRVPDDAHMQDVIEKIVV